MSEETTASALGQIAFAEYYGHSAGMPLVMPDSWNMQPEGIRADWEAAAVAVAAHVTTPTAEDFDHAAEIMRLRGQIQAVRAICNDKMKPRLHTDLPTDQAVLARSILDQIPDADL